MGEDNNINNGCDQFTRPEEILELQKYLRAIKEDLAERTELGTDVVQMDPSYRAGEIDLDRSLSSTGRVATNMNPVSDNIDFSNAILGIPTEGIKEVELDGNLERVEQGGQKSIDKLPDTKETINVERIERLEKVREKLLGADTNSPRELETYVEKLDITPEAIDLGNELIKITGETKEINLSQERVDLVNPKIIDSLETKKEKIKGEIPEITLGEGSERIPFLETKDDQLSNYKEPIGADQRPNQKEIELGKEYSSIPNDQGHMFNPTTEDLPDAVLGIPGEVNDPELGDTRINLPEEGEHKELSLSNFLDMIEGESNELSQLSREIEDGGHVPQGQKEIDSLDSELKKEGKVSGENNTPNSLDSFLAEQNIIPGSPNEINDLRKDLPKGSLIEGELKTPSLHDNLSKDGYIEGELKTPSLHDQLPKEGYMEGELKTPSLHDSLPKDGYVEGELKTPSLHDSLPKDGYVEGELKTPSLHDSLPKDGYVEGELKDLNLDNQLHEDNYTTGEFETIDELLADLPKDGSIRGEFEDIDRLPNKLPKKDGKVRGEFEDIDRLPNKLPKKDGKVRGEFEDIDKLSRKLPKKDGYTRGDFKKIKELTEELPAGGYVEGELVEIRRLTKKLPGEGYIDGDFVDLREELTEALPEDGYVDGDFVDLGEELTKELPEEGYIEGDGVKIKSLPEELTKEGKIDEEDLVEIKKLPKDLSKDGKIDGDLVEVEHLTKKLPKDGYVDGDSTDIDRLTKKLPEGGNIEGDFKNINELSEDFTEDGLIQGDFRKLGDLAKDIPEGGNIEGDFKSLKISDTLPKDGHIGEDEIIKIKKLPKELTSDGHIQGEYIDINKLPEELPEDGHIGEDGIIKIKKLPEELPEDGHIGEDGIVDFQQLPKKLSEDGYIRKEGLIEFDSLPKELTEDGISEGDFKEIQNLDSVISDDGYIEGDFKNPEPVQDLPLDGYMQGDLVDITELDKVLSNDGLIHGGESGQFSEEIATEELYRYYSDSNDEIFSITGGTIPESSVPKKDNSKHITPEELYEKYSGKNGGIYVDPVTREVKHGGIFQIPDGAIARDTFSASDPSGEYNLYARRHPLELDNSEFSEIGGLIPKTSIPKGDNWKHRDGNQLDNKKFDEIGGLIPNSEIPRGDNWEHRDGNQLDNKKFDEIGGLIPKSELPGGDDWEHSTPEDKLEYYSQSQTHAVSVNPKTKEVEYEDKKFKIKEGIVPDSEIPEGDIWEHEDLEVLYKKYSESQVRKSSINPETGQVEYEGEFAIEDGIAPKNSRPEGEPDPKLYEWLQSLTKVDAGAGDLYHALLARAGHDLDGYYTYLLHYAENKDLSTGWGQKIAGMLSSLGIKKGASVDIDKYKAFEEEIAKTAMVYYAKEGKVKIEQSHLPRGLDAYMTSSGYLRYMADLVRTGGQFKSKKSTEPTSGDWEYYGHPEDGSRNNTIWSQLQGALGLQETMLDSILMELVKLRNKGERATKSNRDRLPGGTGILQDFLMTTDVWNTAVNLGKTFLNKLRSNKKGGTYGDTTNPINRPVIDDISYDPGYDLNHNYDNFGQYTKTEGWYDPYDRNEYKEKGLSGKNLLKAAVKDTFSKSGGQEINYRFDTNYLQGTGIRCTLYDLADHDLDNPNEKYPIDTVEDFMNVVRWSPLISEPSKFIFSVDPYSDRHRTTTLDTNNYWEVVIEPYLGVDNGYCSYLPKIEEINVINELTHGYRTLYSRWIPIISFDLSRTKTTTKSIGLFGGEFTIPGGIEFSNELRITVLDDVFKSWRNFFEKCSDVGVYNSRIHNRDFYIDPNISKNEVITVVDKTNFVLAPYKNVTFRIRIYIMTPQYSTINKYDLLATLKEISVERAGEVDPGSQDLELTFSIVGETDESYLDFPYVPKKKRKEDNEVEAEEEEDSLELYYKELEESFKTTGETTASSEKPTNKVKTQSY